MAHWTSSRWVKLVSKGDIEYSHSALKGISWRCMSLNVDAEAGMWIGECSRPEESTILVSNSHLQTRITQIIDNVHAAKA